MTKAQIKAALQKVTNKYMNKRNEDDTLRKLMDLNEHFGDGHRWCSYESCLKGIIKGGDEKVTCKALDLYRRYCENEGAVEAVIDMQRETNYLNF